MRQISQLWLVAFGWVLMDAQTISSIETQNAGSGAALLKTDLLGVFAHPDDETGVAALLAHYALATDRVVAAAYCTRGEGGGNMIGTQSGPALGLLREVELRECLEILGVRHVAFLDQEDFAYTENLGITMDKWGEEKTLERLVRVVRAMRPEVIVTMNPAPSPGQHGHHQAAGWLAVEAFTAAANPERFPEQLDREGLGVWQVKKLYFGGAGPYMATLSVTTPLGDGRVPGVIAGEALSKHRSQGFGRMAGAAWLQRPQRLQLVKSVVPFVEEEMDLFRGLSDLPQSAELLEPIRPPEVESPEIATLDDDVPKIRFLPRLAVERYQDWVKRHGIQHAAMSFVADIPVVAGEPTAVPLEILDHANMPSGTLLLEVPDGWKVHPDKVTFGGEHSPRTLYRIIEVTAPEESVNQSGSWTVSSRSVWQGKTLEATAQLHPVPKAKASRLTRALPVESTDSNADWLNLPVLRISPDRIWQGNVRDAADSSADIRVAHDGQYLYVEVRVQDDQVISNLAPDDIKGHWRTDSVEICVDPDIGAEHTLGCFKLGIIPFDSTGRVRAARDADARPGPVDLAASDLRLVSWRTDVGYTIRTAIPLRMLKVDLTNSRRVGFNVLIYDGDKVNAVLGENINKSRLAWSPRSGVQGRPEDWGRLDLE
jgi:LmbE family N-acetylglucosaminyl deacetylase